MNCGRIVERWSAIAAGLWLVVLCAGCNRTPSPPTRHSEREDPLAGETSGGFDVAVPAVETSWVDVASDVRFTEVQEALGLDHTYQNGQTGKALIVETIGGGGGWLDIDNDGWPDLVLNQGGDPTAKRLEAQPSDRLFRNRAGNGLDDVTVPARFEERFYSQGVAVADYNGDGFDDIYITNVDANTLWMNCGDGTFHEVAQLAGVADPRWSTSAGWADIDLDGDLDLYVCNYCVYDPRDPQECKDAAGYDTICNPNMLDAWPDSCFINLGDGTFRDEAGRRGMNRPPGRGLGVAIADFTNDGRPDIYVANDTTDNNLFVNQGDGGFVDEAPLRGCAVDREGNPQGSMGLAIGDYDGNGWLDIYCTHYYEESNTLYANQGEFGFQDRTALEGLHQPTLSYLGFGAVMADFDANGLPELLVANGHVDNSLRAADPRMKPQLFTLSATGRWVDLGSRAGSYFGRKFLGRGIAVADYDGDGDLDPCIVHENAPTAILRNDSGRGNWLCLHLVGSPTNRRAVGTRVTVQAGPRSWMQEVIGGGSYASSSQPGLHFGLGESGDLQVHLQIRWFDGRIQDMDVAPNQQIVLQWPPDPRETAATASP